MNSDIHVKLAAKQAASLSVWSVKQAGRCTLSSRQGFWRYFCLRVLTPCSRGLQTLYTEVASNTLGPVMLKALYRGYTDATFATLTEQPAQQGLLGPLISAQVRLLRCLHPRRALHAKPSNCCGPLLSSLRPTAVFG